MSGSGQSFSQFKPPEYAQEDWQRYLSGGSYRQGAKCEYCGRFGNGRDNCAGCGAVPTVRAQERTSEDKSDDDDSLSPSIALAGMAIASSFPETGGGSVSGDSFSGGGGDFGGGGATGSWDSGS